MSGLPQKADQADSSIIRLVEGCRGKLAMRSHLTLRIAAALTNQGDQLAAASYPNPNDAKAALGVLVGDALDHSREYLAVGWFGLDLHEPRHSVRLYPISKHCTGRKSC
jgi:hypothetical protein